MIKDKEFYKRIGQIGLKRRWEKEHSKVRINPRLSKEKIAINAYLCGDGYIAARKSKNNIVHHEIQIILDNFQLCEYVVNLFIKEFNIKPRIEKRKDDCLSVRIDSKPMCIHLLSLGKYKSLKWAIPKNLNKEQIIEWIKCFFDCEAYVNLKKKIIQVKSINHQGLNSIKNNLAILGIESKVYGPYYPKNKKHSSYSMLNITKLDVLKYKRLINFHHPDKRNKLEKF